MSEDELIRFEQKWREIYLEGIEKVFRIAETKKQENFDLKTYTKLYTMVYDICVSKSNIIQVKCYERLIEIMRNYCRKTFDKIKNNFNSNRLIDFVENWVIFEDTVLKWILKFFSYLVKEYI